MLPESKGTDQHTEQWESPRGRSEKEDGRFTQVGNVTCGHF